MQRDIRDERADYCMETNARVIEVKREEVIFGNPARSKKKRKKKRKTKKKKERKIKEKWQTKNRSNVYKK